MKVGKPYFLFDDTYEKAGARPNRNYDVTSDGQRFLMVNRLSTAPPIEYITLVTNWIEDLQNKLSEREEVITKSMLELTD